MCVELENLREQLMSKIDTSDLLEVAKVERYVKLIELNSKLDEEIKKDGLVLVTENGAQRFVKSHPAINDKMKANSQIIAIEKTFNFISEGNGPSSSPSTVEDNEPTDEDLV